ncbi:hypothetical protein ScPMuIL_004185 [Solemya velum]
MGGKEKITRLKKPPGHHHHDRHRRKKHNWTKLLQNNKSLTVGSSFVGVGAILVYVYLQLTRGQLHTFVSALEHVTRAVYDVNCSKDYESEKFIECKPKRCARVVRDGLISEADAAYLLNVAKKGLAYGGSNGGASILDLHSGALSKGDIFINIYSLLKKDNIHLFTEEDFMVYKKTKDKIQHAIAEEFGIPINKLYLTKPTFFSRMNTTEAQTIHDEYWHAHIDKETYGSFHYTSLLYLTTYGQEFTGGRFIFIDPDKNRTVEPKLARVSFFTSGSENVHYVEKVEDGTRYAITISFTCDPEQAISEPSFS